MFGYTAEEMLGNSVLDQIHPDDQGRAVEGWLAVLSTRRDQQTRLRRKRKDGSWMWVDTTLHNFLNQPDRNYVLVEIIDISAEMQAQEALQEREELLRRLTNAMPVGLLHLDTERNVMYHNARLLDILYGSDGPTSRDRRGRRPREPSSEPATRRRRRRCLKTLTEEGTAELRRGARRSPQRRRRPRRRGRHHAALGRLAARADQLARADAPRRRGQRRDLLRARRHRQRPRAPGARAARDLRPAHAAATTAPRSSSALERELVREDDVMHRRGLRRPRQVQARQRHARPRGRR